MVHGWEADQEWPPTQVADQPEGTGVWIGLVTPGTDHRVASAMVRQAAANLSFQTVVLVLRVKGRHGSGAWWPALTSAKGRSLADQNSGNPPEVRRDTDPVGLRVSMKNLG